MTLNIKKVACIVACASVLTLATNTIASAHVTVRPAEVVTAGFQTFTVSVPNEKDIPTTQVKLLMPDGLEYVTPTQKADWKIALEQESQVVTSITWSGGEVGVDLRDEFTFSARVPADATELTWKAYQTYSDGSVAAWDESPSQSSGEHGHSDTGPYSVTNVITETASETAIKAADKAAADAKVAADRSLYVAIAGIVVGLIGVFFATRKR